MGIPQLYYTSCRVSLRGAKGFQINAASSSVAGNEALLQQVERLGLYLPPRTAPSQPSPEEISAFPISLQWQRLATGHWLLAQGRYAGTDHSGRFGNFFTHSAIIQDPARDLASSLPIQYWRSDSWTMEESPTPSLPELEGLAPGRMRPEYLDDFLREAGRGEHTADFLWAVEQALKTRRRIILVDGGDNVALWVALASFALPRAAAEQLTFNTYVRNPYQTDVLITGTTADSDFAFTRDEIEHRYYVLDFINGRFTPMSGHSQFSRRAAEFFSGPEGAPGYGASELAGFGPFSRRTQPPVSLEDLDAAFGVFSSILGHAPPPGGAGEVLKWCASHRGLYAIEWTRVLALLQEGPERDEQLAAVLSLLEAYAADSAKPRADTEEAVVESLEAYVLEATLPRLLERSERVLDRAARLQWSKGAKSRAFLHLDTWQAALRTALSARVLGLLQFGSALGFFDVPLEDSAAQTWIAAGREGVARAWDSASVRAWVIDRRTSAGGLPLLFGVAVALRSQGAGRLIPALLEAPELLEAIERKGDGTVAWLAPLAGALQAARPGVEGAAWVGLYDAALRDPRLAAVRTLIEGPVLRWLSLHGEVPDSASVERALGLPLDHQARATASAAWSGVASAGWVARLSELGSDSSRTLRLLDLATELGLVEPAGVAAALGSTLIALLPSSAAEAWVRKQLQARSWAFELCRGLAEALAAGGLAAQQVGTAAGVALVPRPAGLATAAGPTFFERARGLLTDLQIGPEVLKAVEQERGRRGGGSTGRANDDAQAAKASPNKGLDEVYLAILTFQAARSTAADRFRHSLGTYRQHGGRANPSLVKLASALAWNGRAETAGEFMAYVSALEENAHEVLGDGAFAADLLDDAYSLLVENPHRGASACLFRALEQFGVTRSLGVVAKARLAWLELRAAGDQSPDPRLMLRLLDEVEHGAGSPEHRVLAKELGQAIYRLPEPWDQEVLTKKWTSALTEKAFEESAKRFLDGTEVQGHWAQRAAQVYLRYCKIRGSAVGAGPTAAQLLKFVLVKSLEEKGRKGSLQVMKQFGKGDDAGSAAQNWNRFVDNELFHHFGERRNYSILWLLLIGVLVSVGALLVLRPWSTSSKPAAGAGKDSSFGAGSSLGLGGSTPGSNAAPHGLVSDGGSSPALPSAGLGAGSTESKRWAGHPNVRDQSPPAGRPNGRSGSHPMADAGAEPAGSLPPLGKE